MKTAFIFSAGRGERLRPITDRVPKALCTVHGITLLEYHLENLAAAGIERVVINHAYLGGQIRQLAGDGRRWGVEICYAPEPPGGLETAGGIINALPLLGKEPFLTVNADIFSDYQFASLALPATSMVHLVLVNKPHYLAHADFNLSATGQLDNLNRTYTFAGIACYRPQVFASMKFGRYSLVPLLRELTAKKQASGEVFQGYWIDIGTPARLGLANGRKYRSS